MRIAAVAAFAYAVVAPASYALLFAFMADRSALIDIAVVGSCVILVANGFKPLSGWLFVSATALLIAASLAGIFVHFRDSGASGPLPYEWLNGYYLRSTPLLLISSAVRFFSRYERQWA